MVLKMHNKLEGTVICKFNRIYKSHLYKFGVTNPKQLVHVWHLFLAQLINISYSRPRKGIS